LASEDDDIIGSAVGSNTMLALLVQIPLVALLVQVPLVALLVLLEVVSFCVSLKRPLRGRDWLC